MRLEWIEDEGGDHFAEVANLYCIAYTRYQTSQSYRGDIRMDDCEDALYVTKQHLTLGEMKLHLEEKLVEILKVWHDAYEELAK